MSGGQPLRDADPRPLVISAEMLAADGPSSRIDFERGIRLNAPATLGLIAACCGAFVWQLDAGGLANEAALVRGGALVRDGLARGEVWRLLWSLAGGAMAAGPATLDSPRPPGHVVDTLGLLKADDVAAIERLATGIEAVSGGDLVVVVVRTTGGRPHRAFATALFNRWALGAADRDDGLLIFVATDDRKAEIVLGDGVDDDRQRRASQQIMDEVLTPEFRAAGLRKAALACGTEILSAGPEAPLPDQPLKPAAGPLVPVPPEAVADMPAEPFLPEPKDVAAEMPVWRPPPREQSSSWLPLVLFGGGASGSW